MAGSGGGEVVADLLTRRLFRGRPTGVAAALLDELEASQWWSPERIATAQARRLRHLLVEVGRHHPALRDRFAEAHFRPELVASVASLAGLPPVDLPEPHGGGVAEAAAEAWQRAVRWHVRRWWGIAPTDLVLSLTDGGDGLDAALDALRSRRPPRAVAAAGETLLRLARRAAERRLEPLDPPLRALFAQAVGLDAAACAEVAAQLGAPVATCIDLPHVGLIAHACPEGGLHLCGDHLLVEVVKPATGRPVKRGREGEVVVTDTSRHRDPVVRCRTGLRGRLLSEPCLCGRGLPLIEMAPA